MTIWTKLIVASAFTCAVTIASPAAAQAVVGATSVSSPSGSYGGGFELGNIINQSGLSSGYTSGLTNYATFVASTTISSSPDGGISGFTNANVLPQILTFSFGSTMTLDALAFFAVNNIGSVTQFELYADSDGDFSNGTGGLLGTFNPLGSVYSAQSFTFAPVATSFLQLRALNTVGGPGLIPGIGELAFRSAAPTGAVPEPSSWALMLIGFGAVGFAMRRRRADATRAAVAA